MTTAAIIVAAGRGLRLGGPVPKQYQRLSGRMVLTRTLEAILACPDIEHVLVAIHPDYRALYDDAVASFETDRLLAPIHGGAERADTVRLALEALKPLAPKRVLIHDAARPFVAVDQLNELCRADGGAVLAEPVVDALWRGADASADEPVSRADLWRAQTPQAFAYAEILSAHVAEAASATAPALDDTEVYRRAGHSVHLIAGRADNFKITTTADMVRAERLVEQETTMETRTGHGFDVHRFVPGDGVWLCGVHIKHSARLDGHSDADVGLHALSDALYGALAEGDIGTHFPPTDPQWKGAESHVFLTHAAERVRARGGRVVNFDITLLCEAPKIAPHAAEMRSRMSEITGVSADRISVKATTMERMGFVGREEGMGAIATATVELPREAS